MWAILPATTDNAAALSKRRGGTTRRGLSPHPANHVLVDPLQADHRGVRAAFSHQPSYAVLPGRARYQAIACSAPPGATRSGTASVRQQELHGHRVGGERGVRDVLVGDRAEGLQEGLG
jgi:hypothetical protein